MGQWKTENVLAMARAAHADRAALPILADALEEAGAPADYIDACRRGYADVGTLTRILEPDEARDARLWRRSPLRGLGVLPPRITIQAAQDHIWRKRPRGSGSRRQLAERLIGRMTELAHSRWRRACRGQRVPTERQAAQLMQEITNAVDRANGMARERLLTPGQVLQAAKQADRDGHGHRNGGTVTAQAYGWRWETTAAAAHRRQDGMIVINIERGTSSRGGQVIAPAKWFQTVDTTPVTHLKSASHAIVRNGPEAKIYDAQGNHIGYAKRMPAELSNRFGQWEHGRTLAEIDDEIRRKREIIAAEARQQAERIQNAKQEKRLDRAARLYARISAAEIDYATARAAGCCQAGIERFAQTTGRELTARVSLSTVHRYSPQHAQQIARKILMDRQTAAASQTA